MKLRIYQIDAFAERVFTGNPAAVCILDNWLADALMQDIAAENNLAETAFAVKKDDHFELRWFTPTVEVDLCGHATLATAFVLFEYYAIEDSIIKFHSPRSGQLTVEKAGNQLTLDFPSDELELVETPQSLIEAFGQAPLECLKGKTDYLLIYPDQQTVESFNPDLRKIAEAGGRGTIISATGEQEDFISRFFAPQSGVDEDPVTGSAHTSLTPYWAKKLNKNKLTAKQLSKRSGQLHCEFLGNRVKISGKAIAYLVGDIDV